MVTPDHNMNPTKGTTALGGSPHASSGCDLAVARLGLLAGAALATLLVATGAPAVFVVALLPATVAAAFDLDRGRLPDPWVATTAVATVVVGLAPSPFGLYAGTAAVVAALVAGATTLAVHLVAPAGFGWGDVKYAVALAVVVGAAGRDRPRLAVALWLCIAAGSALAEAAVLRRRYMAFGPHLLIASVVIIGIAPSLGSRT